MNKMCHIQSVIFKKDRCIFCQEKKGVIHEVAYMETGSKILDVAEKLQDMPLLLRLNNIPNASDAVANDVQYHRKCLVAAQRKANVEEPLPQELENVNRIAADIEIQDIVVNIFKESTESVTDMKSLNTMYNNLLGTNEVNYLKMFQVCSLYVPLLETNLNEFVLPVAKAVLFKKLSKLV